MSFRSFNRSGWARDWTTQGRLPLSPLEDRTCHTSRDLAVPHISILLTCVLRAQFEFEFIWLPSWRSAFCRIRNLFCGLGFLCCPEYMSAYTYCRAAICLAFLDTFFLREIPFPFQVHAVNKFMAFRRLGFPVSGFAWIWLVFALCQKVNNLHKAFRMLPAFYVLSRKTD